MSKETPSAISDEVKRNRREMLIIREVNYQGMHCYDDAVALGNHAAFTITGRHRAQMTGLENIANSALKVADVLDYVKRQTARFSYWRQGFAGAENPDEAFGERLRAYLEKKLAEKCNAVCNYAELNIGDKTDEEWRLRQRIHLLLIRQFVRQLVVHYEYSVSFDINRKRN